jgi:hypothetical protein
MEDRAVINLFSAILEGATSWGVGRLFDTITECRCGTRFPKEITNVEYNRFQCRDCGRSLNQYINSTSHTVNRNKSIVSVALYNVYWPKWRGTGKIYWNLDVINSAYDDVVVELALSEFRGSIFHIFECVRTPQYEYSYWEEDWIKMDAGNFPHHSCTVAVDLNVYNTWGDLLDNRRRLMEFTRG